MSWQNRILKDALYPYYHSLACREPLVLQQLRQKTEQLAQAYMQITPEQGQFLHLLVQLSRAKNIIEIGTFTGYSTISMATALPNDGQLIACDISAEWTAIAKKYCQQAGVASQVEFRVAPALETLEQLLTDGKNISFDFAFIDADKKNYDSYYEYCLLLLKVGGLIVIDNVLATANWLASDTEGQPVWAANIHALNHKIHTDRRVEMCMLAVGNGMTIVRKL